MNLSTFSELIKKINFKEIFQTKKGIIGVGLVLLVIIFFVNFKVFTQIVLVGLVFAYFMNKKNRR